MMHCEDRGRKWIKNSRSASEKQTWAKSEEAAATDLALWQSGKVGETNHLCRFQPPFEPLPSPRSLISASPA
jgi:hypothetical protein